MISTLSEMARPGMKADWFSEIAQCRTGFSLSDRSFEITL